MYQSSSRQLAVSCGAVEEKLQSWWPDSSAAVRMAVVYLTSRKLKEGEAQKEVLVAEYDEEKESEVDGEVEERESHSTCA